MITTRKSGERKSTYAGFTIVELLIVIVVIGILAAISIVAYNGIQNRADRAALKSDLANAAKSMAAYTVLNETHPKTEAEFKKVGLSFTKNVPRWAIYCYNNTDWGLYFELFDEKGAYSTSSFSTRVEEELDMDWSTIGQACAKVDSSLAGASNNVLRNNGGSWSSWVN